MAANTVEDQDDQQLLNHLFATLNLNQEVRSSAEASLQPGLGAALSRDAAYREMSSELSQIITLMKENVHHKEVLKRLQEVRRLWKLVADKH
ncbi:hypothetical protein Tsubulata_033467 [Turnera subulata]|uniref:Uncharacterized protein n=1 Tax=Turnera subulata TaxID=218843 RepID=A0A9Q0G9Q1_9ROSI|nr:hypothetical protein Tsubulata_033467 [Turnera subulata]